MEFNTPEKLYSRIESGHIRGGDLVYDNNGVDYVVAQYDKDSEDPILIRMTDGRKCETVDLSYPVAIEAKDFVRK